jgi:hypothetical protein
MTSQEMMKAKDTPGHCWTNIAAIDEEPNWVEIPSPHGPHSDPNYGFGKLFGYDQDEFLTKQYKK